MQPTTPRRPVMDVTVRSRTAPAASPAAPPEPQPQPVETAAPAPATPAATAPVPEATAAPETPVTPEMPAENPAPAPEPPATIDVHEAPQQYEDESAKPALQTADHPKDVPAMHPEQTETPAEESEPVRAGAHQQPKPKSASTTPVGTIVTTLFVMAVLAGLTVMVYLQS